MFHAINSPCWLVPCSGIFFVPLFAFWHLSRRGNFKARIRIGTEPISLAVLNKKFKSFYTTRTSCWTVKCFGHQSRRQCQGRLVYSYSMLWRAMQLDASQAEAGKGRRNWSVKAGVRARSHGLYDLTFGAAGVGASLCQHCIQRRRRARQPL